MKTPSAVIVTIFTSVVALTAFYALYSNADEDATSAQTCDQMIQNSEDALRRALATIKEHVEKKKQLAAASEVDRKAEEDKLKKIRDEVDDLVHQLGNNCNSTDAKKETLDLETVIGHLNVYIAIMRESEQAQ